jgi:hypothetical protein
MGTGRHKIGMVTMGTLRYGDLEYVQNYTSEHHREDRLSGPSFYSYTLVVEVNSVAAGRRRQYIVLMGVS